MPEDDSTAEYAVLFDMDGTLVNTEPLWEIAEIALLAEYGISWSRAEAEQLTGWALERAAAHLQEQGLPLEVEQIIQHLESEVLEGLRQQVPWCEPGRRLLDECRAAAVPTALVTMSRRRMAQFVIDSVPGTFAFSVTGDEVQRPKPDPQPYSIAADALGVPPHRCIALEDSETGARAALAAGCVVYTTGPNAGKILGLPALCPQLGLADLVKASFQTAG